MSTETVTRTGSGMPPREASSCAGSRCRACGPMPTSVATAARSSSSSSRCVVDRHRLEVRLQRRRQAGGLVGVHPEQAQRPDQLGQVVGGRRDHDQPPAGAQDAGDLRAVARGEDDQHPVDGGVRAPAAGPRCRRRPASPAGAPGRPGGRRSGEESRTTPTAAGSAVEHAGQVVAGAAAEVEQRRRLRPRREHGVGERRADAGVVPGGEEGHPVGDHLRRVAGGRPVPGRQQRHVALPGPVEGVPGRGSAGPSRRRPRRAERRRPGRPAAPTAAASSGGRASLAAGRRGR